MGFPMHCLRCERRSTSSGQFLLSMYRKCAPSVVNIFVRGVVLFILGACFAIVLFVHSVLPEARKNEIRALDFGILASLFGSVWWIAPSCGTAAAVVGLIYPCSDIRLGTPHKLKREWSSVARCVVLFLGISHACAKISFNSSTHLTIFMALCSVLLWWLFDRSKNGFGLGVLVAIGACIVLQSLIYLGVFRHNEPDFLYARSWIPTFFFSGVVTFGTIGRQLAMVEYNFGKSAKEHVD